MARVKCLHDELPLDEYNKVEKTCKMCGKSYFKAWTKTGYSDFCSRECSRGYSTKANRQEINEKISKSLIGNHNNTCKRNDYEANPKTCPVCGKVLPFEMRKKKTCGGECAKTLAALNNRGNKSGKKRRLS